MVKVNDKIAYIAMKMARQLDKTDGTDNKISSDTWKKHAVKNWGAKNNVSESISVFNAAKSIEYYLRRESRLNGDSAENIGEKWYSDLIDIKQEAEPAVEAAPVQTNHNENTQAYAFTPQNDVLQPVSTNVVKPVIENFSAQNTRANLGETFASLHDDKNINEYVKLAKLTSSSSAKAGNDAVHNNILDKAFDNVIQDLMKKGGKKRSVLLGTASDFIAAAKKNDVDIFTLMGISMIESAYGTSKMALSKNNVGGLTPNGSDGIHCQTVSDSINIAAQTLHKNIYNKGLDTIKSVGMRGNYCCAGTEGRAQWVNNVTFFANKVRNEYNRLLEEAQSA